MNYRVLDNRISGIRKGAGRFFAGVETAAPIEVWRGLRPMTPDGLPIIGRAPRQRNVVVATGHNMNGIMYGPITGRLVAEMVGNRTTSVDLGLLRAERFGPL